MTPAPTPTDVSRRQLLATAGTALGGVALGTAPAGAVQSDCEGIDYLAAMAVPDDDPMPDDEERVVEAVEETSGAEQYCTLERAAADQLGVTAGDQLRVDGRGPQADEEDAFAEALFTVRAVREDEFWRVRSTAANLVELGIDDSQLVGVSGTVPHPCYDTREEAIEHEEFVETTLDAGPGDSSLVVLAPHGGYVEPGTDRQAEYVASEFGLPAWICYGRNAGGDTYDRWHVTSTAISEDSFPEFAAIDRDYDAALAFHGRSFDEDDDDEPDPYVGVGGGDDRLKRAVANNLEQVYADADIELPVCVVTDEDECSFAGTDEDNVVNRVTADGASGVQLEQPSSVRDEHRYLTATAAIFAIRGALRTDGSIQREPDDRCPC